jgi:hypothetical protein
MISATSRPSRWLLAPFRSFFVLRRGLWMMLMIEDGRESRNLYVHRSGKILFARKGRLRHGSSCGGRRWLVVIDHLGSSPRSSKPDVIPGVSVGWERMIGW